MKYLLIATLLLSQAALADELCSSAFDEFQEIADSLIQPRVKARFELADSCEYKVTSTVYLNSKKSAQDILLSIVDPAINQITGSSKSVTVKEYKTTPNPTKAAGPYTQYVSAKKGFGSSSVTNICNFTNVEKTTYECNLKEAAYLKKNKTTISCVDHNSEWKRCTFHTEGLAKGAGLTGPCHMATGGAAETVSGVLRLAEYLTFGKTNIDKWDSPGKIFYNKIDNYNSEELKKKNFIYEQQIQ